MTQLKLDKIALTSLVEAYINYDTLTEDIVITGSVGNGATSNFTASIPYIRSKTRADVYARNTTTGEKQPVWGGSRINPYTAVSTETCSQLMTYSGTTITVTYSIFNGTGGSITLVDQTIEISAVLYEVPYTS